MIMFFFLQVNDLRTTTFVYLGRVCEYSGFPKKDPFIAIHHVWYKQQNFSPPQMCQGGKDESHFFT